MGQKKGLSIGSTVTNPTTGDVWLDRNLGAGQVATAPDDADAYGDYYQWGRGADGHESHTSPTTDVLSSSDSPKHDNFIIGSSSDWRNPQNDDLWQGVSGINNPCPSGFRLPTRAEWETERASWSIDNHVGAYSSPLKLVVSGERNWTDGTFSYTGIEGFYWSSTVDGIYSYILSFHSRSAGIASRSRACGMSVRCIKD